MHKKHIVAWGRQAFNGMERQHSHKVCIPESPYSLSITLFASWITVCILMGTLVDYKPINDWEAVSQESL